MCFYNFRDPNEKVKCIKDIMKIPNGSFDTNKPVWPPIRFENPDSEIVVN